ncbi:MAG: hypothetical protein H6670_09720 [Anaerolineaceae bacterium]|nr:hypothetical protein [Anaerolineaceae bacterium]
MESIIQLLQNFNIDLGSSPTLLLCCCGICIVGMIVVFGLQFIGVLIEGLGHFLDIFLGILGGGPFAWCGCLVVLAILAACGIIAIAFFNVLGTCGTPAQVNLCRLFGY